MTEKMPIQLPNDAKTIVLTGIPGALSMEESHIKCHMMILKLRVVEDPKQTHAGIAGVKLHYSANVKALQLLPKERKK